MNKAIVTWLCLPTYTISVITTIFIAYNIYFATGWDVATVCQAAYQIAEGAYKGYGTIYYSIFPNNILITYIFSKIYKLAIMLGITGVFKASFFIVIVQCLLSCLCFYLFCSFQNIQKVNDNAQWIGIILFVGLVSMSPWFIIPYSDAFGLIFPLLFLYLYTLIKNLCDSKRIIVWGLLLVVLIIGYKIKPQTAIVGIAIFITELFNSFYRLRNKSILQLFKNRWISLASLVFIFLSCTYICNSYVPRSMNLRTVEGRTFGVPHFFMMGLDHTRGGTWSKNDVDFSNSFKTNKERNAANLLKARERINSLGMTGVWTLYTRKNLTNFHDGTFAWGFQGTFYKYVPKPVNNWSSEKLRNIFYNKGKNHAVYSSVIEGIWLFTVLGMFGIVFSLRRFISNDVNFVALLSVLGLIIFETLFEARARYLFTYVPIMIYISLQGWHCLYESFEYALNEKRKKLS